MIINENLFIFLVICSILFVLIVLGEIYCIIDEKLKNKQKIKEKRLSSIEESIKYLLNDNEKCFNLIKAIEYDIKDLKKAGNKK